MLNFSNHTLNSKPLIKPLIILNKKNKSTKLIIPHSNQYLAGEITEEWFSIDFWKKNQAVTGSSLGRNRTWFINYQQNNQVLHDWVLRHYYRGGLIGKLITDKYWYTGLKNTRCYKELQLLELMRALDLPVPKPIAAKVEKNALFCRMDILLEKIPAAKTLIQILTKKKLPQITWQNIGGLLKQFHNQGIDHSDLNANNILLDNNNKLWLIDFDKCRQRFAKTDWQQANLDRLKRSFSKEKNKNNLLSFEQKNWQWLLQGYTVSN